MTEFKVGDKVRTCYGAGEGVIEGIRDPESLVYHGLNYLMGGLYYRANELELVERAPKIIEDPSLDGRPGLVGDFSQLTGDDVSHPVHYTSHPSGVECIDVTEHMNFNLGNAVKYIWRADLKGKALQDLEKAAWYVGREIERRKKLGLG